jgi:O-antigen/teichoic acid export membrane protein
MSIARQSIMSGFSHTVCVGSMLIVQIIIARIFGPEGRGIFASAYAISAVLVLMLGTGHGVTNAYLIASGKQKMSEASGSSILGLIFTVMLIFIPAAFIMYFRPSFAVLTSNQVLFWAFLVIPFNLMSTSLSGILRGKGRSDLSYWYYGIMNGSWLIALIALCYLTQKKLEIVFIGQIIGETAAFFAMLYFLRADVSMRWLELRITPFIDSITYGLKFYFTRIVNPMVIRIEIIVIPLFLLDGVALGIYAQAFSILSQVMVISNVVGYVLMPHVAQYAMDSAKLTTRVCRVVLMTTLVSGLFIMLVAKPLVPLIFGKDFSPAVPLMWIMFPGIVLRSVPKVLYHYFQGINRPMIVSIFFLVSTVAMLAIDWVLIPKIGISGAAIGTLASCLLETAMFSYAFIRISNAKWTEVFIMQSEDWKYLSGKCTGYIKSCFASTVA